MMLKIKDFIINAFTGINEFLIGITEYSVQHLGWTTAVVAAILALTAIVFSQYNDRNITKINEYDYLLRNETNDVKKIRKYVSEMFFLLKNTKIYEDTLALFKYVSYFIVFIWIIVVFGYLNGASTPGDSLVIILSTILVTIPFLRLPSILQKFNEKKFDLRIQKNNTLDYLDLKNYWKELEIEGFDLIKDIINPTVKIKQVEGYIYFEFSSELAVSDLQIFVTCIHRNKVFKLSHILKSDNKKYMLQLSKDSTVKNTYDGLFEKLVALNSREISVYLIPVKDRQNLISYQGSLMALNTNEIEFQINSITQDTFTDDSNITEFFFYSDERHKDTYNLK